MQRYSERLRRFLYLSVYEMETLWYRSNESQRAMLVELLDSGSTLERACASYNRPPTREGNPAPPRPAATGCERHTVAYKCEWVIYTHVSQFLGVECR